MTEILTGTFIMASLGLWFWALTDITGSRFRNGSQRTAWLVGVLFFPIIGSILYFQLKKRFVINRRAFKPNFHG